MGNCCGPFKRGRAAVAVNPDQQCFVDCCGNLCPPEGCCDKVQVNFQCGCGCDCSHAGYNFNGLLFKRKRSRMGKIPTFSKRTLAANGFTFANDGTVPTPPSSSSSSSSTDCCDWDGRTFIDFGESCNNVREEVFLTKVGPNTWTGGATLSCGDSYTATVTCDPAVPYYGPESCATKWSLELTLSCVDGLTITGIKEECQCNAPQIWSWSGDTSNCSCCTSSSSSSSSSSSCECGAVTVTLSTSGCCLYMAAGEIEAVGAGTVAAEYVGPNLPNCLVSVKLNGTSPTIEVADGDVISVSLEATGDCQCCEVGQNCSSSTSSMWLQKSNADGSTVALDRQGLMDKVRFAARRVRGSRRRP